MFCERCGARLEEGDRFCPGCGVPLEGEGDLTAAGTPVFAPAQEIHGEGQGMAPGRMGQADPAFVPTMPLSPVEQGKANLPREPKRHSAALIVCCVVLALAVVAVGGFFVVRTVLPSLPFATSAGNEAASDAAQDGQAGSEDREGSSASGGDEADGGSSQGGAGVSSDGVAGQDAGQGAGQDGRAAEYILPESNTRRYSEGELNRLSTYELFVARNEVFARYGRGFKNQELAEHFAACSWYTQRYTPEEFDAMESPLNEYEKANVEAMRKIEEERNSPYLS